MQPAALQIAITLVSGITAGVALTLFFALTVLPTSAQPAIANKIADALAALQTLHSLCWLPVLKRGTSATRAELQAEEEELQQPDDVIVKVTLEPRLAHG